MSLYRFEGFDWIGSGADLISGGSPKWVTGDANTAVTTTTPTDDGKALNPGIGRYMKMATPGNGETDELIVGWHFYATTPAQMDLLQFDDDTTEILAISMDEFGNISADRGGTIVSTCTQKAQYYTWQFIEVKVLFDQTAGTIDWQLNGVDGGGDTGLDNMNAAGPVDRIDLIGSSAYYVDNFYMADTTSGFDFLGPSLVTTLFPNANNSVQFTPNASTNYDRLVETDPDGDTTYNSSTTDGHEDTFDFASFGTGSDTIEGVQSNLYGKIVSSTSGDFRHICISNVTTDVGSAAGVTTSYGTMVKLYLVDPDTSSAWGASGLDAAKFGYRLVV